MNAKPPHNDEAAMRAAGDRPAGTASDPEPARVGAALTAISPSRPGLAGWSLAVALALGVSSGLLMAEIEELGEPGAQSNAEQSEPAAAPTEDESSVPVEGDDLALRLAALEQEAQRLSDSAAELSRNHEQLSESLEAMDARLERSLTNMSERTDAQLQAGVELQRQIAMLEAAALLNLGQQQAELIADVDGAIAAYRRAQAILMALDDARLDRVRRALARELDALESLRVPDLAQAMARLERLARESRRWPSQLDRRTPAEQQAETDVVDETPDWRDRIGGAARGLVRVQARDEIGRTSEQFESARELMQLRLVAAQLALTRHDADALALQVGAALDLLDEWFDVSTEAVQQGRRDIEDIKSIELKPDLPDLGEALNLLRTRLGEV